MTRVKGGLLLVGILGVAASISTCEKVPLTAPAGSSIFLQANPTSVPANGGRSLVTALVVEPAGTLVPDGTQVLFLTTLGRIDETAKTVNGIARVYFVSDARSGEATVTAISGGPAVAPSASPSPTPTPSASAVSIRASSRSAGGATSASSSSSAAAAGTGQAQIKIKVGATLPDHVVVGANPQRITSPRHATIVATVYDDQGNPVQNVPVIFKITEVRGGGSPTTTTTTTTTSTSSTSSTTTTTTTTLPSNTVQERLESGGSPRFTDSSGQAFDVLYTTDPVGGVQKIVKIRATTSNGKFGEVEVAID
jgi:hypothetical protein